MNYKHAYHVGSVADVFKHCVVIQLLQALAQKPSAFSYIETHAGAPFYNLLEKEAQKTNEYQEGIGKLWKAKKIQHPAIISYLETIKSYNPSGDLLEYPGSSVIARDYLRPIDEAVFCELHPEIHKPLRYHFYPDKQSHVHHRDGYEALLALIPPKTKRGLVLIDPPFENPNEFEHITQLLKKAAERWSQGIYTVWFPIKHYDLVREFYHSIKKLNLSDVLTVECWVRQDKLGQRLNGSGLLIVNPPWQFNKLLNGFLPEFAQLLEIKELGKMVVKSL